ncbi:MAG: hypothetical protein ACFFAX_03195 [Promethearchaeota archaeon]
MTQKHKKRLFNASAMGGRRFEEQPSKKRLRNINPKMKALKQRYMLDCLIQMEPLNPSDESSLRSARRIGIVFLAYAIGLPLIIIALGPQLPPSTGPYMLSWVLMALMPVEILLIYVFYWFFSKSGRSQNIMGPSVLMYTVASTPSIYAFIIGFTDSALSLLAIPLGLMFSLVGLWLASMFISKLWSSLQEFDQ